MTYSIQQNLIVNGNFTSGSSSGWSYSEDDSSGVASSNFNVSGGADNPGVWYFEVNDSAVDTGYNVSGNLTNDGGVWLNSGTIVSATALFSYKQTWGIVAPIVNNIKVFLIRPDSSELLLFTRQSIVGDSVYTSESIDVGINNFSESGTYKIKLYNLVDTAISDMPLIRNFWDDIDLVIVYLDEVVPQVTVQSPLNKSYNLDYVWANLTLDEDGSWCGYSLDGTNNVTMSNTSGNWNSLIEGLSDASHNITFSCNDTTGNMNASAVTLYFTVDTTSPDVYILSPENITYTDAIINLNVSSDETIDTWWYSLNGASNITFSPNTTVTLSLGNNNVTVWANDSAGNVNMTTIYFSLNSSLNVVLVEPSTDFSTNIVLDTIFQVNATVVCDVADCGNVFATIKYNKTSSDPDTSINITYGAQPLFVDEAVPFSTKSCSTNPLSENEYCNITWLINATDITFSDWKIDVNFSSDSGWTTPNETESSTIVIASCFVDITVGWTSIDFIAPLSPNTYENPAVGNVDSLYNITVQEGSCNTDMYIRGTDMVDDVRGYVFGIGNLTWNNVSNQYSTSYNLTETYAPLMLDVAPLENITTWFWINVPPIFAANYTGTVYLQGVKNGESQP